MMEIFWLPIPIASLEPKITTQLDKLNKLDRLEITERRMKRYFHMHSTPLTEKQLTCVHTVAFRVIKVFWRGALRKESGKG